MYLCCEVKDIRRACAIKEDLGGLGDVSYRRHDTVRGGKNDQLGKVNQNK
jgi:hypothetical protein